MIELIQFPWSPFCLVQKRILEFGDVPHKVLDIEPSDRSLIWRLTKERYYQVPILRTGRSVLFETDDQSQVLAKYLDCKFGLGLFPRRLDGLQSILWRYVENEIEGLTFKLNDVYFREFVPKAGWWAYLRHKERRFGKGCVERWTLARKELVTELSQLLVPFEQMLANQPFLLGERPHFLDFDLWGMLANYLYTGHYRLPGVHARLKRWYQQLSQLTIDHLPGEKLRSGH